MSLRIYDIGMDDERPVTQADLDEFAALSVSYGRMVGLMRQMEAENRALVERVRAIKGIGVVEKV